MQSELNVKNIKVVGFDLDGTLYPSTPQTEDRETTAIAKELLRLEPSLKNLEAAKTYVSRRYAQLKSKSAILREAGFRGYDLQWTIDAKVEELLKPDKKLAAILERIHSSYVTFLLTSSPHISMQRKLQALQVPEDSFHLIICSDTPTSGSKSKGEAYRFAMDLIGHTPEEYLYVGDRLKQDILAPKTLGIKTAAVWSSIPQADISMRRIYDLEHILFSSSSR